MKNKFKIGDTVVLTGTKSNGLSWDHVVNRNPRGSHKRLEIEQVTGKVRDILRALSAVPIYDVRIDPPWQKYFDYMGLSFAEKDLRHVNEPISQLPEDLFDI